MPIALDASSKKFISNAAVLTQAHTCSGVDRVLVVALSSADADYMVSGSITYGGVSLGSPILSILTNPANIIRLYVLVNPPAGTANIVATPSQNTYLNMIAASYTGVDQVTPVSASNSFYEQYSSATISTAITTPAGGVAVSVLLQYGLSGALSTHASQTLVDISADLFGRIGFAHKADATDMAWTPTPTAKPATHLVVALKPAGGGGTDATAPGATLTGTGTVSGGAATGGGAPTGSFAFDACENNTHSGPLNNVAVNWTWLGGTVGAITSITNGAGTMTTTGMTISGLPTGAGFGVYRTSDGLVIGAQEGTVA